MCIYIYIFTYIHIYIHTYIYISFSLHFPTFIVQLGVGVGAFQHQMWRSIARLPKWKKRRRVGWLASEARGGGGWEARNPVACSQITWFNCWIVKSFMGRFPPGEVAKWFCLLRGGMPRVVLIVLVSWGILVAQWGDLVRNYFKHFPCYIHIYIYMLYSCYHYQLH